MNWRSRVADQLPSRKTTWVADPWASTQDVALELPIEPLDGGSSLRVRAPTLRDAFAGTGYGVIMYLISTVLKNCRIICYGHADAGHGATGPSARAGGIGPATSRCQNGGRARLNFSELAREHDAGWTPQPQRILSTFRERHLEQAS